MMSHQIDSTFGTSNHRSLTEVEVVQIDSIKTKEEDFDEGNSLAQIESQRISLLNRLKNGGMSLAQKKLQIKFDKDFEDQTREITVQLIKNMHNACVMDYESIKKG